MTRLATKVGKIAGHDIGRIIDISTEWPEHQPGETFVERQAGAMLRARMDDSKAQGWAPQEAASRMRGWILADLRELGRKKVVPEVVTPPPEGNPLFAGGDLTHAGKALPYEIPEIVDEGPIGAEWRALRLRDR